MKKHSPIKQQSHEEAIVLRAKTSLGIGVNRKPPTSATESP